MPHQRDRRVEAGRRVAARPAAISPAREASWYARILDCLGRADDPLSMEDLVARLGLDRAEAGPLRDRLALLEARDVIAAHRRGRWSLRSRLRAVVGRVSRTGDGGGFVDPLDASEPGLRVDRRRLSGAAHGDWVIARRAQARRGGRPTRAVEPEVIAVLVRRPSRVLALLGPDVGDGWAAPRDRLLGERVPIAPVCRDLTGSAAVAWADLPGGGRQRTESQGRIVEVLGPPSDTVVARAAVAALFDLPGGFPSAADGESRSWGSEVDPEDLQGREDFTRGLVLTMDPEDARDHDDAVELSATPGRGGPTWRLSVHVADVARYVEEGSALDAEALRRGTTVYLPGLAVPMLPAALSSDLCSLRAGRTRLVQSVLMEFDAGARRRSWRVADGFVRCAERLTYREADALLECGSGEGIGRALRDMEGLSRSLHASRIGRGALDLDRPELKVELDGGGQPVDVRARPRGRSERIVEEFMIAANEAVASWLAGAVRPALYRVHEEPDADDLEALEDELRHLGLRLRPTRRSPSARVQAILHAARGRPEGPAVALMVLRAMKRARYSAEPLVHFGLALRRYTHFTSPIRRYPDLVAHRIAREALGRPSGSGPLRPAISGRLPDVALECSRLERRAEEAERAASAWMAAVVIGRRLGETLPAVVTGVRPGGLRLTLDRFGVECVVPLQGRGGPPGVRPALRLGSRVQARIVRTDPLRGIVEAVVPGLGPK